MKVTDFSDVEIRIPFENWERLSDDFIRTIKLYAASEIVHETQKATGARRVRFTVANYRVGEIEQLMADCLAAHPLTPSVRN